MAQLSPLLRQATPLVAVRGRGSYLYDRDGREYLDFTSGIGVTSTGHCHPRVVAAARKQLGSLIHGQYTTIRHEQLDPLIELLGEVLPPKLDSIFFANAGTEATEAAIRLARQATGRPNIVVFHGSFHGRSLGAASLTTSGDGFRSGFSPLMSGVVIAPFPHAFRYGWTQEEATRFALQELDFILETVTSPRDTAAFIVEPVLGEGGYIPLDYSFAQGLQQRAADIGAVLILDEVQTGFGRTGEYWGHDHLKVAPGAMTIGKGLASGFPLSAMAAPQDLMAKAWTGSQGGTFGANAVACAAAIATLRVISEEKLVENAASMGVLLKSGLGKVAAEFPCVGDVRGLGLMLASEFVDDSGRPDPDTAARVQDAAYKKGLLLLLCGPSNNVVRMIPPLIVTQTDIDRALDIWHASVGEVSASIGR